MPDIRDQLHHLIDELPEEELPNAKRFLEVLKLKLVDEDGDELKPVQQTQ